MKNLFTEVDVSAYDCGITMGVCDQKLFAALLPLDGGIWDRLTFALVASFLDEVAWGHAHFKIDIEVKFCLTHLNTYSAYIYY